MSGQKPSITSIPAKYMNELAKGITRLNKRIEVDVSEMCRKVLKPFNTVFLINCDKQRFKVLF